MLLDRAVSGTGECHPASPPYTLQEGGQAGTDRRSSLEQGLQQHILAHTSMPWSLAAFSDEDNALIYSPRLLQAPPIGDSVGATAAQPPGYNTMP
eukprot:13870-Eustigmatos_ZCMA.PRE.1